jgi:hypothetical protein
MAEGLMLGINPGNARQRPMPAGKPYVGPEYLVVLHEGDERIAGGRSRIADEAIACARAWLDRGLSLEVVERELPFVDARRRRLREIGRQLEGLARVVIEQDPGHELWAYCDGRSCELRPGRDENEDGVTCSFYLGQAKVARAEMREDVRRAVESWLVEECALSKLAGHSPGVEVEPHAEVLEGADAGRWHWLHVPDRLADPSDVCGPCSP